MEGYDFMLKGKVAVVTGGGRGIGRAIALKLAENGADIVINYNSSPEYAEAVKNEIEELGVRAVAVKADVGKAAEVEELINTAVDLLGGVDILVNNAGITRDGLLLRMSEADWDAVMDTNLKGAFNCIKAVSRVMMKKRSGSIINITSVVGVMGNAGQANYAASKAGMIGLTKTVAKEFSARNIRCNAVAPGFIKSDMTETLPDEVKNRYFEAIPLSKFGNTEDVAKAVLFLASDMSSYITGQTINVDGGLVM